MDQEAAREESKSEGAVELRYQYNNATTKHQMQNLMI
jgi:hypothetical protein